MQFKITNPNHKLFGKIGIVTRVDVEVEGWFISVKLEDGEFISAQQGVAAELLPPGVYVTELSAKDTAGDTVTIPPAIG